MTSSCLAKQFTEMCGPLASGPARLHPGSTQDLTNQQLRGKGSHTGVNKYLGDSCVQPRMRTHTSLKHSLTSGVQTPIQKQAILKDKILGAVAAAARA